MQDQNQDFPPNLTGLSRSEWLAALRKIGESNGFAEPLGKKHAAIFVEQGDTLLVSFETMEGVETLSETRTPLGFDMVAREGWSHLALLSHGDTWFRDPRVWGFFDQLLDDGFFDDFDNVVFYGAGSCGYAAAAYSVASPGARVLVVQPQATLDPRVTEWDDRFSHQRRRDFTTRYGYAPDMLDAAHHAHVLYDPRERMDAMHSALFERRSISRYRLPFMGGALQGDLYELELLPALLKAVAEDGLNTDSFAKLYRTRREHPPYLRKLMQRLDADGRTEMTRMLCQNVVARMYAPKFRRRLAQIEAQDDQA